MTAASHLGATVREAELARDEGIQRREDHADPRLLLEVEAKIADLAATGQPFSADTLRPLVSDLAKPLIAGRLQSTRQRKNPVIVWVGEIKSTHGPTHAKKIGLYVGAEHVAQDGAA